MGRQSTETTLDPAVHEQTRMTLLRHLLRRGGSSTASEVLAATGIAFNKQHMHTRRLSSVGYINIHKSDNGTTLEITAVGRAAIARYRALMLKTLEELTT